MTDGTTATDAEPSLEGVDLRIPGSNRRLNEFLLSRQKVGPEGVKAIAAKHAKLDEMLARLADQHVEAARAAVGDLEAMEFDLQSLWGFARTAALHSHWVRMPHCACDGKLNDSVFGQGVRFIAGDCAVHSGLPAPEGVVLLPDKAKANLGADRA